ncbi:unnamed protein product [Moneuplotes crassus]|uniref:Transmembrane protein n=1 Tax=Euplotes crassus TaxID=5936 RepID=A0AAD1XH45_EUPCR|nr:unnamed protein product [Moneuplotes crassus]
MFTTLSSTKGFAIGLCATSLTTIGGSFYLYNDRKKKLDSPIAQRALKVLLSDKRVVDFCGENIKPGYFITTKENKKEGSKTYTFKISGGSGKLKTVITADSAFHGSLKIFNEELEEHHQKKETKEKDYDVEDFEDNWPIDLEEYNIPNDTLYKKWKNEDNIEEENKKNIFENEKIWRIKSLRVSVDEDTRILLLPLPESKREKKLIDTRYALETNGDLYTIFNDKQGIYKSIDNENYKRFEDKTSEEIEEDIKAKRRKQFQTMTKVRKYQFMFFFGALIGYILLWPRISPKPILNSTMYHYAVDLIQKNKFVKQKLGENFMVVSCNGQRIPFLKHPDFEIVAKGKNSNAKFLISPSKDDDSENINSIYMLSSEDLKTYKI